MKKLLAVLCLTVLAVPTMDAYRGRGGNCNTCKPCNKPCKPCPSPCAKCPAVRSCPGRTICVSPPCADDRRPCDSKVCTIEELPVRAFRKCKRCVVETCGPIEFECPASDEIVQRGELGDDVQINDEAAMAEQQQEKAMKKRGRMRKNKNIE